jgi:tetratricopeptide (TPR) repeat protein
MSGSGSGGGNTVVYNVSWKLYKATDPKITEGLVLYWFPASMEEIKKSPLKESRPLSLYAAQCVTMQLADGRTPNAETLTGTSKLPFVVLAKPDGTPINRVESTNGKLKLAEVEKLVGDEIKAREATIDTELKDARAKAPADKDAAIKLYQAVAAEKCMFAKKAKEAEKELKKLGAAGGAAEAMTMPVPNFDPKVTAQIMSVMRRGLIAENAARYLQADKLYTQAHKMDPADPTPLRYLGELYRHHIGDWNKARVMFDKILDMPADPLSRAVALHGLGKMTIHDGEFKKGLHLMEQSAEVYPLALTYRNLAVYWNSEYDFAKGSEYTQKALALDPKDPYNLVFAAVFMAAAGKKDEALKIARENANLMPASYNLAAIYAQNGHKEEALAFLKRHFFQYERYQTVREKEMMEARVDAVFDSIRHSDEFMALTSGADGKLPMPMSPKQAEGMRH